MKTWLLNLKRSQKQIFLVFLDVIFIVFAIYLSFVLRIGKVFPSEIIDSYWILFSLPVLTILIFQKLNLYKTFLKYIGTRFILNTFLSTTMSCLIHGFFMWFFKETLLPNSIIPIFWCISNILIIAYKFLSKAYLYSWVHFLNDGKPTIIYGAGSAGIQILKTIRKRSVFSPVAFVDDDESKHGSLIGSLEVYSIKDISKLIKIKKATVLILAIPSINYDRRKELLKILTNFPIEVKQIPSIENLDDDILTSDDIKHVEVNDILNRAVVSPKKELLEKNIKEKNILVTGAGGSIGSELCRQIIILKPKTLVFYENSEYNLYKINQELNKENKIKIVPLLATVTNYKQIKTTLNKYNIDTIFHAAAYKHVPIVELNPIEGVYNNVIGTYFLAKAANEENVKNMVLISSDKAVRPTNVMGASKRFSEIVLQAFSSQKTNTCFSMVRFGNVIDSAGSVVPLFRQQINSGGPVTITHRNITRYFMSIPEAVQLVIQAGSMARGGDVFVLDMGEPIKILDLAIKMIHLSGLKPVDDKNPAGDIKIKFTGLRPGEKLYEELLIGNDVVQSEHPSIMQATEECLDISIVEDCIKKIIYARKNQSEREIKTILLKYVNGYSKEILSSQFVQK